VLINVLVWLLALGTGIGKVSWVGIRIGASISIVACIGISVNKCISVVTR
jgi:hypothetical protein